MQETIDRIVEQLKIDEGFRARPYWDNDQWTYGYGTKAPGPDATITKAEAGRVLIARVHQAVDDYDKVFAHATHVNLARFEALVNMLFNLGLTKFKKFRRMISAVNIGDWGHAAYEAADSRWYGQVGPRAKRIVLEILTGKKG